MKYLENCISNLAEDPTVISVIIIPNLLIEPALKRLCSKLHFQINCVRIVVDIMMSKDSLDHVYRAVVYGDPSHREFLTSWIDSLMLIHV